MTINQRFEGIIKEYGSNIPKDGFYVDFLVGGVHGNVFRTTVVGQGYTDEKLLSSAGFFKSGNVDIPVNSGCVDDKKLIELLSEQDKKGTLRDPIIEIRKHLSDSKNFRAVLYVSNLRKLKHEPYPLLT